MARSVAQIQTAILANIAANPNLTYVDANNVTQPLTNNTSMFALFNAICFCVALAMAVFEQLQDLQVIIMEGLVAVAAGASTAWVQYQMFQFQYSITNPQVVSFINGVTQYPSVDPALKIVTGCAVYTDITNTVNVKFAIGSPTLSKATSQEIAAAQSYMNQIGGAGINYEVTSLDPDLVYIDAKIYYDGTYSNVIQTNVINAINAFLSKLSNYNLDGSLKVSQLEDTIAAMTGVNDVVLQNVYIRQATATPPSGGPPYVYNASPAIPLVLVETWVNRIYTPNSIPGSAGYYVSETTVNFRLTDSLTFISQ